MHRVVVVSGKDTGLERQGVPDERDQGLGYGPHLKGAHMAGEGKLDVEILYCVP